MEEKSEKLTLSQTPKVILTKIVTATRKKQHTTFCFSHTWIIFSSFLCSFCHATARFRPGTARLLKSITMRKVANYRSQFIKVNSFKYINRLFTCFLIDF